MRLKVIKLFFKIILIFSLHLPSNVFGLERLSSCQHLLINSLQRVIVGRPTILLFERMEVDKLVELLRAANISKEQINEFKRSLRRILSNSSGNIVLNSVVKNMDQIDPSKRPLLCLLSEKECRLRGNMAAAYLFEGTPDYETGFVSKTYQRAEHPRNGLEQGFPRLLDIIFLKNRDNPTKSSMHHLLVALLHEFNHFVDMERVSTWIKANGQKIARGDQADYLFKRWVRRIDGILVVDISFLKVLTESRAHQLNEFLYRTMGYPSISRKQNHLLWKRLKLETEEGFLAQWDITERNANYKANSWVTKMDEIIHLEGLGVLP